MGTKRILFKSLGVLMALAMLMAALPVLTVQAQANRFVDLSFDGSTGGWGVTHFASIQAAINAADPGDTIEVGPGTYAERLIINKSLNLHGVQYGVDPTAGGRGDESIITQSGLGYANPDIVIDIPSGVNNVIVDGFTLIASTGTLQIGRRCECMVIVLLFQIGFI